MKRFMGRGLTLVVAIGVLCLNTMTALALDVRYNEYGAHEGLNPDTQNADMSALYTDEAVQKYLHAPIYIVSDQPTATGQYSESGIYYEATTFVYGDGLFVIIQDEDSTGKFYTLIKSAQDLNIGEPYRYAEGDIGGRLLDDKYTSTHMAHTYLDGEYSYVSYDLGGGKLSAQEVALDANGALESTQPEGFTYVYLVAETPADYYQRLANEAAGYEQVANFEDRTYMPVNNTHSSGNPLNNWANIEGTNEERNYNDRITRIGGMEGDSNTRLYSYSGQNVIVAKACVAIEEAVAKLAWSKSNAFDPDADYETATGEIELAAGETMSLYFHSQFTNTWGRDGYRNVDMEYEIADESIISYVGNTKEEGVEPWTLTGLQPGTTTLTATVLDSAGKYAGGASVTLTVTVK